MYYQGKYFSLKELRQIRTYILSFLVLDFLVITLLLVLFANQFGILPFTEPWSLADGSFYLLSLGVAMGVLPLLYGFLSFLKNDIRRIA